MGVPASYSSYSYNDLYSRSHDYHPIPFLLVVVGFTTLVMMTTAIGLSNLFMHHRHHHHHNNNNNKGNSKDNNKDSKDSKGSKGSKGSKDSNEVGAPVRAFDDKPTTHKQEHDDSRDKQEAQGNGSNASQRGRNEEAFASPGQVRGRQRQRRIKERSSGTSSNSSSSSSSSKSYNRYGSSANSPPRQHSSGDGSDSEKEVPSDGEGGPIVATLEKMRSCAEWGDLSGLKSIIERESERNVREMMLRKETEYYEKQDPAQLESLLRLSRNEVASRRTPDGFSTLISAAKEGHLRVVKFLVEECDVDVNPPDSFTHTALRGASMNGHLSVVKYLVLECRADVDRTSFGNRTPLMGAAMNGYKATYDFLLEQGAEPRIRNSFGEVAADLISW